MYVQRVVPVCVPTTTCVCVCVHVCILHTYMTYYTYIHECASACKKRKTDKLGIHVCVPRIHVPHLGAGPSN